MQASRTRFTAFDEPEPLADYHYGTAPTLTAPLDASLMARIDEALAEQHLAASYNRTLARAWTAWVTPEAHSAQSEAVSGLLLSTLRRTRFQFFVSHDAGHFLLSMAEPVEAAERGRPSSQLETSLGDIQRWLRISLATAADVAGISRGTVYAWRERASSPRPATVGAVLRVHGLVATAVAAVGEDHACAWFHSGSPSPLDELILAAGDTEQLRRVSLRVRRELAAPPVPPPDSLTAVTADDLNR